MTPILVVKLCAFDGLQRMEGTTAGPETVSRKGPRSNEDDDIQRGGSSGNVVASKKSLKKSQEELVFVVEGR